MYSESSLIAFFLVGLLGGGHCLGMCGGIVAALSLHGGAAGRLPLLLGYNLGRLGSYVLAGMLAGLLGSTTLLFADLIPVQKGLYALASLLLVALGLYLAGIWHGISAIERLGNGLWQQIQPHTRHFLPADRFHKALLIGALWGWIPCGLVYTALVGALASGSPERGALTLLAFGAGTLPNLLAMGLLAEKLRGWMRQPWLRRLAGGLVAGFGILGLLRVF
jgi:hypothetical protein